MDKGGTTSTNTISKSDPWSGLQPYLSGQAATPAQAATQGHFVGGMGGGNQGSYGGGYGYGGAWVPGTPAQAGSPGIPGLLPEAARLYGTNNPDTMQGLDMTRQRAMNGSPINTANASMFADTLNGKYLDPNTNPYLKGTFDQGANAVQGRVNSMFQGSNRTGSGLQQDTYQKNLNDLANTVYGGNYQQERSRQMAAGSIAPSIANQDYFDASQLMGVGNHDNQKLATYAGLLGGVNGGGQNQSNAQTPYFTNPISSAAGTGLTGYLLYKALMGAATGGAGAAIPV